LLCAFVFNYRANLLPIFYFSYILFLFIFIFAGCADLWSASGPLGNAGQWQARKLHFLFLFIFIDHADPRVIGGHCKKNQCRRGVHGCKFYYL